MKKTLIIVGVVVALALVVMYVRKPAQQVATSEQTQQQVDTVTESPNDMLPAATKSATQSTDTVTPSKTSPKLAYGEAVKRYGAQRIQFDAQCQAIPTNSTFKSGLEIMLDNRAGVVQSVAFGGKTYKIPAYDYAVVTLTAQGIIYIDCGASQNVAKLTVQ